MLLLKLFIMIFSPLPQVASLIDSLIGDSPGASLKCERQ